MTAPLSQRAAGRVSGWLAARTSRRGFLVRAGVVGAALATDPVGYALRPGTAYANVCGPGTTRSSGWTVFCATVHDGVNACPPGSIAAGWWKADGASLCGGRARYIVDCNATCSRCSSSGRAGICGPSCWSCRCGGSVAGSCDQRNQCCNAFRYGQCNTQVRQVGAVQCRVVSCTPPWTWENCSAAPATDDRTRDHTSDHLPLAWTALTARYVALGENGSVLGASVWREFEVAGGRAQRYQRGRISWSRGTGAHETVGPVSTRYVVVGGEAGALGFPTAGPVPTPDGVGRASRFQYGRISWSAETGAWDTRAQITLRYEQDGAEGGPLGYPVGQHTAVAGGAYSRFQHGRVSWHPAVGVFLCRRPTADRYALTGGEAGPLGFPTADQVTRPDGGTVTTYQGGRVSGTPATGTWAVLGAVAERYVAEGAEDGALGFPTGPQARTADGGVTVPFEHGSISVGGSPATATVTTTS